VTAHHRVHDHACCHLQADCLESGISSGPLRSTMSMGTFTFFILLLLLLLTYLTHPPTHTQDVVTSPTNSLTDPGILDNVALGNRSTACDIILKHIGVGTYADGKQDAAVNR